MFLKLNNFFFFFFFFFGSRPRLRKEQIDICRDICDQNKKNTRTSGAYAESILDPAEGLLCKN